ncbi:MAG: InlB B-repeat-containing protein [Paludibacteraceae bacterium]|nr:InlB B-repeat-containing protein [Paludibacteraceae bacterium]
MLINNGTLPAGNYTIPANVTLLIPFDEGFTCYTTTPALTSNTFLTPEVYRTLTMSPGATLTVNGAISVSAKLSSRSGYGPNGATSGKYGAIKMQSEGNTQSKITLNSGAKLYGWGYIYGEGAIEALSGATVYEGFVITDWRGGNNTLDMYDRSSTYKVFPFNQYYIQNIEVPLTIHKGATESVYSSVYGNGSDNPLSITMVGTSEGLFRLTGTGAKLTKWYDPLYDRQHYVLEGAAAINAISFSAMGQSISSSAFVLPITNNMDITVRSGATVSIAEDVCIMPDASVTVEQGATMNIASAKNVYVYDIQACTNAGTYTTSRGGYPSAGPGRYAAGAYVRRISYSPSWAALSDREIRRLQNMSSAHFQVNGTLIVNGKLYTTEGGADIFSTADGAAVNLVTAAGTANKTYQVDHENYDAYYYTIPVTSAQLHNADGSYQATAGNAANTTWTYAHGHWGWCIIWRLEDGTELKRMYQPAQPNATWISSNAPETSKPDEGTCSFVFNDWNTVANTSQQEIILTADYTKTCAEYYDVLWKSEDGIETYETDENVGQGETTRYNGAAPVKADDEANGFTYTFDGWTTEPNGGGTKYNIGETPAATGNATYYAHFAATEVAATVTANGVVSYYPSIADAFTAANASDYTPTIQVWRDAPNTPALTYTAKNHCTLDLNGHTVSGTEMPLLTINDEGYTFTVTDRTETKEGRLAGTSGASTAFVVSLVSGVFRLEAGTVYGQNTGTGVMAGVYAGANREVIMTGGTIQMNANSGTGYGIFAQGKGTINGGTIRVESSAKAAYAVQAQGANGNVTVTDGKFYAAGKTTVTCVLAKGSASMTVNGGYYNTAANLETYKAATCRVYDLPSTKLPYRYTVTEKTPLVASVTINSVTTEYSSFADAWSAVNSATAASTLKLLDDVDLTTGLEYTNASKNCMLDLNGHIISGSATPLLKIAQNGITFTITDLSEAKEGRIECNTHINGQKWAVEVSQSTLRFEGGTIYAKNTQAGTLFIGIYSGASGVIEISGGNIHTVTTANNPTYGVLTFGTATISSGSIQVEAAGTGYAVEAYGNNTNILITGGNFYATGSSAACVHRSKGTHTLRGGYYNSDTNLAAQCATNYHVFPNDDATYLYKVAEGYTVTFNTNGHGSAPESQLIEKNTNATTPTAPTATGYTFGGWYKEAACTNEWDFASDEVTAATTLFAKWSAIYYSISYDLAGGSVASENPTSYTVESSAITLNNPTKANYVFAGWTGTGLGSATINVTISEGSTGNRSYTATWTPAVASVTVNEVTTYYTTFDDAWSAVNSATAASTIQLLQDVTVTTKLTYNNSNNKDCILDLNGHALTSNTPEQSPLHINNTNVTFTITDGTENKSGKLSLTTSHSSAIFGVYVKYGAFRLEGGTIEVNSGSAATHGVTVHYGTFTMNGGTIHVKTTNGKDGRGIYANSTTIINGGTVHVEAAGTACGVRRDGGTITINGGKFNISGSTASYMNYKEEADANLVIKGGYYTINTRLGTYVSNPYHIFDLTSGAEFDEGYRYKVAEGYTVTFKNEDETLQSGLWEKGTTPIYSGESPVKAATAQYTYTFNGWNVPIAPVTANVIYTAQFSSTVNTYTVTWKNDDGTTLETDENVPYGNTPVYNGTTPAKATDAEYAYTFDTWSPAVSAVTGDAVYTATYTTTPVVASVTANASGYTLYYTDFDKAFADAKGAALAVTITLF